MLRFVRYFLFIALFGIAFSLKATHVRAGEITYKWISGYTYSITLTTYTDDGPSIADRCMLTIYFGDGDSCQAVRQNGILDVSSPQCPTSNKGEIIKTSPNVKKNIYSCTHTYSGPGLFKIFMFDRNRNSGIINMPNSVNQPFYIESLLNISSFLGPNNSSILSIPPIDEGAFAKCFYHNAGAYDIDDDSLSYELVMCKGENGFGQMGTTIPGYTYPATGAAGSFSIDALTGTITWCTSQQPGEYNIAFLIKEYRRSCGGGAPTLIGYVTRDMQVIVNNSSNNLPVFSVTSSTCIQAGSSYTNTINTSDPDNNTLTLQAYGSPFISMPAATFNTVVSTNASSAFSWNTSCANIRREPYMITYKCTDNGMPNMTNYMVKSVSVIAPEPQNLTVTPGLNIMKLRWNKPACRPASGNTIVGYNIYRIVGSSSWVHSVCETGVPVSSGYSFIRSTFAENDTSMVDYTVVSLPNNATCGFIVTAIYKDCSESYASSPASDLLVIGIDEMSNNHYSANVFPNPGTGLYTLELKVDVADSFIIELMDVNGHVIKQMLPTFVKDKIRIQLDLGSFENGYYILKIANEEKNCSYKPIVKLD